MGADLIYAMIYMEVTEEEARQRVSNLTFEILSEKDERNNWKLTSHEYQLDTLFCDIDENTETETQQVEHRICEFVDSVKSEANEALDMAYGAWTRNKWPRDIAGFDIRGNKGILTADLSGGDSWNALEQLELLDILEITESKE
jgi:hypothetical protein